MLFGDGREVWEGCGQGGSCFHGFASEAVTLKEPLKYSPPFCLMPTPLF